MDVNWCSPNFYYDTLEWINCFNTLICCLFVYTRTCAIEYEKLYLPLHAFFMVLTIKTSNSILIRTICGVFFFCFQYWSFNFAITKFLVMFIWIETSNGQKRNQYLSPYESMWSLCVNTKIERSRPLRTVRKKRILIDVYDLTIPTARRCFYCAVNVWFGANRQLVNSFDFEYVATEILIGRPIHCSAVYFGHDFHWKSFEKKCWLIEFP